MTDLLQSGGDWLEGQRTSYMSRSVTYLRDGEELVLLATIGRTIFELDQGYGLKQKIRGRDFLVLAADLIFGAVKVQPKDGDRIQEIKGDRAYIYEVMAQGGQPAWRWSDENYVTYRLHTKLIATEGIPEEPEFGLAMAGAVAVDAVLEP